MEAVGARSLNRRISREVRMISSHPPPKPAPPVSQCVDPLKHLLSPRSLALSPGLVCFLSAFNIFKSHSFKNKKSLPPAFTCPAAVPPTFWKAVSVPALPTTWPPGSRLGSRLSGLPINHAASAALMAAPKAHLEEPLCPFSADLILLACFFPTERKNPYSSLKSSCTSHVAGFPGSPFIFLLHLLSPTSVLVS